VRRDELVVGLRQIETLVAECLRAAGEKPARSSAARTVGSTSKPAKNVLTDRIIHLRDKGAFAQPKTAREVHEKLSPTYPCELNRVEVALPRLVKRKLLRKASKVLGDKKQAAYVW